MSNHYETIVLTDLVSPLESVIEGQLRMDIEAYTTREKRRRVIHQRPWYLVALRRLAILHRE